MIDPLSLITKLGLVTVIRYVHALLHVLGHTDCRVTDNRPSLTDMFLPLTAGARARRSRCFRRWSAQRRRNLPGEWPWRAPPSYCCSVCPGCCRTVADWSPYPVRPSWARTCPGCGDHPWAPSWLWLPGWSLAGNQTWAWYWRWRRWRGLTSGCCYWGSGTAPGLGASSSCQSGPVLGTLGCRSRRLQLELSACSLQ